MVVYLTATIGLPKSESLHSSFPSPSSPTSSLPNIRLFQNNVSKFARKGGESTYPEPRPDLLLLVPHERQVPPSLPVGKVLYQTRKVPWIGGHLPYHALCPDSGLGALLKLAVHVIRTKDVPEFDPLRGAGFFGRFRLSSRW